MWVLFIIESRRAPYKAVLPPRALVTLHIPFRYENSISQTDPFSSEAFWKTVVCGDFFGIFLHFNSLFYRLTHSLSNLSLIRPNWFLKLCELLVLPGNIIISVYIRTYSVHVTNICMHWQKFFKKNISIETLPNNWIKSKQVNNDVSHC